MNLLSMVGNNKYVMQAIGAMMRGESPQAFMKNLANTTPELQGLDLDNLDDTAKNICAEKNVDMNQLANQIRDFAKSS